MDTGSFPGVKRPGRGVDHPPPSTAVVKERVELNLYSPFGPLWSVLGSTSSLCIMDSCECFLILYNLRFTNRYRAVNKFTLHNTKQQASLLGRQIPTRSRRFVSSLQLQGTITAAPIHSDTVYDLKMNRGNWLQNFSQDCFTNKTQMTWRTGSASSHSVDKRRHNRT